MKKGSFPHLAVERKRGYSAVLFGVVVGGMVLSMAWAFGAFHPLPTTHAGSNGQQLIIGTTADSIEIAGLNNDNNDVTSPCLKGRNGRFVVIALSNWWWRDAVQVNEWRNGSDHCEGALSWNLLFDVPEQQSGSDWYYVSEQ